MPRREFLARGHAPASFSWHREGVPRLAAAVAVEMPGLEIGMHLGRRHDDDLHIPLRLDAVGAQPAPQEKTMRRIWMHDAESVEPPTVGDLVPQRLAIAHPALPEFAGKGDRIAV